jgi:hypothetical protein
MNNLQQLKQESILQPNNLKRYRFIKKPILLLALILGPTIVTPALAAVWSNPTVISDLTGGNQSATTRNQSVVIVQDKQGRALTVWSNGAIQSSRQTSTGTWGPIVPVSFSNDLGRTPDVAFAPNGDAMAIWIRDTAGVQDIQVATLPVGTTVWSLPTTIAVANAFSIYSPQIKIDSKGRAVAVWGLYIPGSQTSIDRFSDIQSATYTAITGWSPPVTLSSANIYHYPIAPKLAINAAGIAVVVWNDSLTPNGSRSSNLKAVRKLAGGTWSLPSIIGYNRGGSVGGQKITLDDLGRAALVWQGPATAGNGAVFAVQSSTTGVWMPPVQISPSIEGAYDAEVATDKAGNITVVWQGSGGVTTRRKLAGISSWSTPRTFGGGNSAKISASPDGSLVAVGWHDTYIGAHVSTYTPALGWALGWKPVSDLKSIVATRSVYESTVSAGSRATAAIAWTTFDFNRHPNLIINASTLAP